VHALVILNGRKLTRADFASLRDYARNRALTQRRYKDRVARLEYLQERSRSYRPPFPFQRRDSAKGRFYHPVSLCSYLCPVCGRYQALPFNKQGYRCLADGRPLVRARPNERSRTPTREYGLALELSL
jgi:hypothetical protein